MTKGALKAIKEEYYIPDNIASDLRHALVIRDPDLFAEVLSTMNHPFCRFPSRAFPLLACAWVKETEYLKQLVIAELNEHVAALLKTSPEAIPSLVYLCGSSQEALRQFCWWGVGRIEPVRSLPLGYILKFVNS